MRRPLGAGGMGEVWEALDETLGRSVAIKFLPEEFERDADRRARWEREARILASLNHPNIATVYGIEPAGGSHVLALELVEGPTLAERLAEGPMPIREAVPVFRQIAAALEAAHDAGIVHRDLKPANVKITPEGRVKVLDFGLAVRPLDAAGREQAVRTDVTSAQTAQAPLTQTGMVLGTVRYMSPEQARGRAVDRRTDVWAFGCTLFEALSGRPAFPGDTPSDTLARVLEREPDWTTLPSGTPPMLRQLLRRCLQKEPGDRFRDMGDVRLLIEEAVSESGVSQPQAVERPPKRVSGALLWSALGFALGAAAAALAWRALSSGARGAQTPSNSPLVRFALRTPPGLGVALYNSAFHRLLA